MFTDVPGLYYWGFFLCVCFFLIEATAVRKENAVLIAEQIAQGYRRIQVSVFSS